MVDQINGTWDFKWPLGTTIVVAFQNLPERDVGEMRSIQDLIDRYKTIIKRWFERGPQINIAFAGRQLPAPRLMRGGLLNLRSPKTNDEPVRYDVLVSFASLPGVVRGDTEEFDTEITGQVSTLGSYARRLNYGTPTTIVGPNRDFRPEQPGASGAYKRLDEYFDDPIFDEVVLHEFGHVLGIAHQQQNPLYPDRPPVKEDEDINKELVTIRRKYWTKFAPQVNQEIRDTWPAIRGPMGDAKYSDWIPIDFPKNARLENESVMAHPIWSDLVNRKFVKLNAKPHEKPTRFDLDQLDKMYPPL